MAKTKTVYRCTDCGADYSKWQGRCETCGGWNTLVEEAAAPGCRRRGRRLGAPHGRERALGEGGSVAAAPRLRDGLGLRARALAHRARRVRLRPRRRHRPGLDGLVGGEPGIGKSTLLLQIAARMQHQGRGTLYVSGEESPLQVKLRSDRLDEPAGDVRCSARRCSRP
jgi:DNA repair protein RadA/Sms